MALNTKILFINEDYVKKYSPVLNNVEYHIIKSHVIEAQNIDVVRIIGEWMYDEIIGQYEDNFNSGTTIDTKYTTLVNDYIKPTLLYFSLYNAMYDLYLKITNKGIQVQKSEFSDPISEELLQKYMSSYRNKAEFYRQRLQAYLFNNQDTYEKWRDTDPNNPYSILPDKNEGAGYNTGMFFIGKNGRNRNSGCIPRSNLT